MGMSGSELVFLLADIARASLPLHAVAALALARQAAAHRRPKALCCAQAWANGNGLSAIVRLLLLRTHESNLALRMPRQR